MKRPRIAWLHVPALAWAVAVEAAGWICPLTPLERHLRLAAGQTAYAGGFVEHYLVPILYPGSLTRADQLLLATALLLFNAVVYGAVRRRRRLRTTAPEAGPARDGCGRIPAESGTVSPGGMFLAAAGLQGAVLLLALGVGPLLGAPPLRDLRLSLGDAAWGLAAALPPAVAVIVAVHREVPWARRLAGAVEDVLKPLLAGSPARLALRLGPGRPRGGGPLPRRPAVRPGLRRRRRGRLAGCGPALRRRPLREPRLRRSGHPLRPLPRRPVPVVRQPAGAGGGPRRVRLRPAPLPAAEGRPQGLRPACSRKPSTSRQKRPKSGGQSLWSAS